MKVDVVGKTKIYNYDHALADRVSVHALYVNELIPPMEPWVFRLPKE